MHLSLKKTVVKILLIGALITPLLQSCEQEGSSEYGSEVEYYKYNQLKNIYANGIAPLSSDFVKQNEILGQTVDRFRQETSLPHLQGVQQQWKALQLVWKQLELYDLGAIANSFIAFEINRWPTDTAKIEENISGTELLDEAFIASRGSSSKGISAIEYLIFFPMDNTEILTAFTSSENALRRMDYLIALSENLISKSKQLQELWEANSGTFVGTLENGISGSQNQVINAMVTLIEESIISKLGNPLGDSNGGTLDPERFEAYRSKFSKEIIQQHLTALQQCYHGDFAPTPFRVGFDDFLDLIQSDSLAAKISDQFKECQARLNAIEGSLEEELVSNPQAVDDLKNAFRDLLVLVKVDMANVLGSTITFNDNDGD